MCTWGEVGGLCFNMGEGFRLGINYMLIEVGIRRLALEASFEAFLEKCKNIITNENNVFREHRNF